MLIELLSEQVLYYFLLAALREPIELFVQHVDEHEIYDAEAFIFEEKDVTQSAEEKSDAAHQIYRRISCRNETFVSRQNLLELIGNSRSCQIRFPQDTPANVLLNENSFRAIGRGREASFEHIFSEESFPYQDVTFHTRSHIRSKHMCELGKLDHFPRSISIYGIPTNERDGFAYERWIVYFHGVTIPEPYLLQ